MPAKWSPKRMSDLNFLFPLRIHVLCIIMKEEKWHVWITSLQFAIWLSDTMCYRVIFLPRKEWRLVICMLAKFRFPRATTVLHVVIMLTESQYGVSLVCIELLLVNSHASGGWLHIWPSSLGPAWEDGGAPSVAARPRVVGWMVATSIQHSSVYRQLWLGNAVSTRYEFFVGYCGDVGMAG